jgi:hypothetical protein
MAPQRGSGFDQISMMIGELKGSVGEIEKYVHDGRHGINNLGQKFDALAVKIASDIAAVEARLDARLQAVEKQQSSWTGAKLLAAWIVQTVIAAIVAIFAIKGAGR